MDTTNLKELTIEKFPGVILSMTPEQIHDYIKILNPIQLSALIHNLRPFSESAWNKKLIAVTLGTSDHEALKIIGQNLHPLQALEVLGGIPPEKALTLLTGMPYPIFKEALELASPTQLQKMAPHSEEEPIQHHLLIASHEITLKINEFDAIIESLEQKINTLDLTKIDAVDLISIENMISELASDCEAVLKFTQKILILAWNSTRIELIDNLSHAKETLQRYYNKGIYGSIGLFKHLQNHLAGVFGTNPMNIETLKDDEPAIEGLAKLSVWYLQDYWEVGLLPEIRESEFLDLSTEYSEKERTQYRINLFTKVQERLEKLGLFTVKNLKDAGIFSKEGLRLFINKNST